MLPRRMLPAKPGRTMVTSPATSSLGLMNPLSLTRAFTKPPIAPPSMIMPIGISIDVSIPSDILNILMSWVHPLDGWIYLNPICLNNFINCDLLTILFEPCDLCEEISSCLCNVSTLINGSKKLLQRILLLFI